MKFKVLFAEENTINGVNTVYDTINEAIKDNFWNLRHTGVPSEIRKWVETARIGDMFHWFSRVIVAVRNK